MRTSLLYHVKRDPIQVDLHQMTSHPKQGVLVQFKLGEKQVNPLIVELLPYISCMCIKKPLNSSHISTNLHLGLNSIKPNK